MKWYLKWKISLEGINNWLDTKKGLGDTAGSERQDLEIGLRSFQPDRNTHLGQASMGQ